MLIGFSKHGTGNAGRPIDYLTAETVAVTGTPVPASTAPVGYLTGRSGKKGVRREPCPVIVRGDPERVRALIDSVKHKHKYSSGVLSFSPNEIITPDMEEKIITEFEQAAFAGLSPDRYEILWVRHQHTKGRRHELHFLTPRVDLVTGKSLNIAPPRKSTRELFDTLRSKINSEYGLADPSDPARARKTRTLKHRAKIQAAEQDASKIINLRAAKGTPNPERARQLAVQLEKLVARRAAYHQQRYPAPAPETKQPSPYYYDRIGTTPLVCSEAPRIPISGTRPAVGRHAGQLEQATQRWRQACGNLESSHSRFERAYRTVANGLEQKVISLERQPRANPTLKIDRPRTIAVPATTNRPDSALPVTPVNVPVLDNSILVKYGIPARQRDGVPSRKRELERGFDLEMDMTLNDA